ncbi:conserved Plasmodium protein, unknown function [Plasmodium malariae]|uniref:Uncharacterized protein n=1 Tax=Plasmodium malariae TaxID=5858 RepID=A0A1C3L272_PLAMA|nr:conserved Plasmodium protein, unknown function [Plasmodium malariae]
MNVHSFRKFSRLEIYRPSKFSEIKKRLYLKKKLFSVIMKNAKRELQKKEKSKCGKHAEEDVFYSTIASYPENKTRIYKNNKYNVYENYNHWQDDGEKPSIERLFFICSSMGCLELQYVLSSFINYHKNILKDEDILTLYKFLDLSEKDMYDYLCGIELMPQNFLQTAVIRCLLKFINVNHPSLN